MKVLGAIWVSGKYRRAEAGADTYVLLSSENIPPPTKLVPQPAATREGWSNPSVKTGSVPEPHSIPAAPSASAAVSGSGSASVATRSGAPDGRSWARSRDCPARSGGEARSVPPGPRLSGTWARSGETTLLSGPASSWLLATSPTSEVPLAPALPTSPLYSLKFML